MRTKIKPVLALACASVLLVGCSTAAEPASDAGGGGTTKAGKKKAVDDQQVIFKVSGKSKHKIDITYGSDSDTYDGGGPTLPFKKSLKVKKDASYYSITAQLAGGGKIKCSVTIGKDHDNGSASGGYNICTAELVSDPFGGWQPA